MQKVKLLLFFVLFVGLVACDNNNSVEPGVETEKTSESKKASKATMITGIEESVTSAAEELSVQLDDGKKWKANVETSQGVNKMMASVKKTTAKKIKVLEDYRQLGASLQKDFNGIFQNCTMTGEAHDQLHNFLLPMVDMVKTFEQKDLAACEATLPLIKQHLGSYYDYFE
jgi:hypothetical protein